MHFDLKSLQSFHLYWRQKKEEDLLGTKGDMAFIRENAGLQNTAVIERIVEYKGQWEASLVFADSSRRCTFIIRPISTFPTYENAVAAAKTMQRSTVKDLGARVEVGAGSYALHFN